MKDLLYDNYDLNSILPINHDAFDSYLTWIPARLIPESIFTCTRNGYAALRLTTSASRMAASLVPTVGMMSKSTTSSAVSCNDDGDDESGV